MVSWKTTLAGAISALGAYFVNLDDPIMKIVGQVLVVLGPVLMGLFAKDSNVTGGTKVQ
jgi:drug/metabolite transporter (DMT)-like permease